MYGTIDKPAYGVVKMKNKKERQDKQDKQVSKRNKPSSSINPRKMAKKKK